MSKMSTEEMFEHLSALADGELNELELDHLLQALDQASEEDRRLALDKWGRYTAIGSKLNKSANSESLSFDITAAVSEAVEKEPLLRVIETDNNVTDEITGSRPGKGKEERVNYSEEHSGGLLKQFAVAASVCFVLVMGWQFTANHSANQKSSALELANSSATDNFTNAGTGNVLANNRQVPITPEANYNVLASNEQIPVGLPVAGQTVAVNSVGVVSQPVRVSIPVVRFDDARTENARRAKLVRHSSNLHIGSPINGVMPLVKSVNSPNPQF